MSLDDYNILKVIGKGTYGEVHLVTHKKDKKQYVIKKLEFLKATNKERKSAEQEAKLLSTLRHPNIVSYKDSFQSESGHLFIVMGFAEGGDLYTKLRERRENKEPLGEVQTVRWYIQICMALQYLHERRILHRDLKTQNIFLTKTQIIKVGDLGIAKELESANDMATTLIGTPYYMSPELFSNRPYNHKSDVWALGCCMYEMVTLRHAFNAKDINSLMYKILKGKIPAMPEDYPVPLCDLIRDMLNQNPDKRPSVNKILRNSYIKKHIQLFLDESSKKKRGPNGKSSRRSSASSNGNHHSSSRKTSANSLGSSPSPHPPSSVPDPLRPSRPQRGRSKSPNILPSAEQKAPNIIPGENDHESKRCNKAIQNYHSQNHAAERIIVTPPFENSPVLRRAPEEIDAKPKTQDSGVYMNFSAAPKVEKVALYQNNSKPTHKYNDPNEVFSKKDRVASASSASSQTSTPSSRRALPDPAKSRDPTKKQPPDLLGNSGESVVSVASSVAGSETGTKKSARQRRRESREKENVKTPSILEEIRRSRSCGFKQGKVKSKQVDGDHSSGDKNRKKPTEIEKNHFIDVPDSGAYRNKSEERAKGAEFVSKQSRLKNEEEEFMTLLHTTLHLGSGKDSVQDGDSPISLEESNIPGGELSPVLELSEGSTADSNRHPSGPKMTPAATPIHIRGPPPVDLDGHPKGNISANTLRSTQRLMSKIIALRKECIKGLGVPLLHKAYEVLDANQDDDTLQVSLVHYLHLTRQ